MLPVSKAIYDAIEEKEMSMRDIIPRLIHLKTLNKGKTNKV